MRRVALGLLSTARINAQVLAAARSSDCADVVAVASRDTARARAYAAGEGIARAHGSYEDLLADAGVDAVYIALPNSMHVDWAVRALRAGKHVLCEKPLGCRGTEVERAFDEAERADRHLAEAFMYRHAPQTRRLMELVRGRSIGRLAFLHATLSFPISSPDDPRTRAELDGGALMDVGCYCVSGARLLAGEPERVHGEAVIGPGGVDHRFAGTLRFPGGVLAQFDCAIDEPRRDRLEVVGTEGTLVLADPWHCREPSFALRRDYVAEDVAVMRANPYRVELEDFCRAVRGESQAREGRAEAVAQARTLEALLRSAACGRPVELAEVADQSHQVIESPS